MSNDEQQKWYRVLAPGGLNVRVGDSETFRHLRQGRVVPRDTFAQITWLLDDKHIEEADPPERHKPEPLPAEPTDGEAA